MKITSRINELIVSEKIVYLIIINPYVKFIHHIHKLIGIPLNQNVPLVRLYDLTSAPNLERVSMFLSDIREFVPVNGPKPYGNIRVGLLT